ncbi:hypothetical protein [Azoarcus sp. DN11]|uniref:hypothetical protein n=1 Tax=Azoarcus sp. DN11 TaxID=356837 RepID=UPI0013E32497|nr:hypothetical protein [Azoarcus sp. DN11]
MIHGTAPVVGRQAMPTSDTDEAGFKILKLLNGSVISAFDPGIVALRRIAR